MFFRKLTTNLTVLKIERNSATKTHHKPAKIKQKSKFSGYKKLPKSLNY